MLIDLCSLIQPHSRVPGSQVIAEKCLSSDDSRRSKQHLLTYTSREYLCVSGVYLGGRPSRALFKHCGVLSVSAVEGGTSGVSALESPSPSPSASTGKPSLSSPSASCQGAQTHTDIQTQTKDSRRSFHTQADSRAVFTR